MVHGHYEGKTVHDPAVRRMFTRDYLLQSDWYQARLRTKQSRDTTLWRRHVDSLSTFLNDPTNHEDADRLRIRDRLETANRELSRVSAPHYLETLVGTLGADPAGSV
jgi:hypothetical protein